MGEWLIWIGAAVTMLGIVGLIASGVYAFRLRKAGLDEAALRERLRKGVLLNMAALFGSMFGLMLVIVGIAFA